MRPGRRPPDRSAPCSCGCGLPGAARIALARLLASRGETAAGIEELSRAIEVAPGDARLRVELGRQLLEAGLEAEALKAYGSLLEVIERGELSDTSGPFAGPADGGGASG